jgi:5-formaminoimidazole-4-carboxamide-1-(beta)-D-ribofuranosyl 5'-monophosphate synthetase
MPGSPGIKFTPYSEYLFGRSVSMGQRVAMEIKKAQQLGALDLILT